MKILTCSHSNKPKLTNTQIKNGFAILDITVKSGCKDGWILSPSWKMVNGIHSGTLSEKDFESKYYALLTRRWNCLTTERLDRLRYKHLILVCYCPQGQFCHRYLAANFLVETEGAVYFGEYKH